MEPLYNAPKSFRKKHGLFSGGYFVVFLFYIDNIELCENWYVRRTRRTIAVLAFLGMWTHAFHLQNDPDHAGATLF